MVLAPRFRVTRKKLEPAEEPGPAPKLHSWPQRKKTFQSLQVYRDVAEWLTDIASYATRELKRTGALKGRQQVSAARVLDPYIREVAWNALWRIRYAQARTPGKPIPAVPPPPEPPLELELP